MKRWLRLFQLADQSEQPLGAQGEQLAAKFLKKRGYRIVERNLTLGKDEADIVAISPDGEIVVIVEVKTRRDDLVTPEEQVNRAKQYHLTRFAARLLKLKKYRDKQIRFDVIAIVWPIEAEPTIRHHIAAFDAAF